MIIYVLFLGLVLQSFASNAAGWDGKLVEIPKPMMDQLILATDARFLPLINDRMRWIRRMTDTPNEYATYLQNTSFDAVVKNLLRAKNFDHFSQHIKNGTIHAVDTHFLEMYLQDDEKRKNGFCVVVQAFLEGHKAKDSETLGDFVDRVSPRSPRSPIRDRAFSSPAPVSGSLGSTSAPLSRPASLPAEAFSHTRVSSPVKLVRLAESNISEDCGGCAAASSSSCQLR